jgi:hypothetical protein
MNWFTKYFEKDDWRFVGQVDSPYISTDYLGQGTDYTLTYYLYENQNGERKFDVIDSKGNRGDVKVGKLDKNDWVFRSKHYREIVHPWLTGFRNPDFPTHKTAPNHDFKRLLKGKSK